jgi:hypothetical protein
MTIGELHDYLEEIADCEWNLSGHPNVRNNTPEELDQYRRRLEEIRKKKIEIPELEEE